MSTRKYILSALISSWSFALRSWQIWGLLLVVNLLFAMFITTPINALVESVSSSRITPDQVSLTYLYDIFQNDKNTLTSAFGILPITICLYLLWSIFSTGGVINCVLHNNNKLGTFISGGLKFFLRYIRITIYMLLFLGIIIFILFKLMLIGETNFFLIDSEDFLITRGIVISIAFAVSYTLLKLWNDWLKISIAKVDQPFFFKQAISSIKQPFKLSILFVFLLNVIITLSLVLLMKSTSLALPPIAVFVTQLVITVRMWYKIANLSSLNILFDAQNRAFEE